MNKFEVALDRIKKSVFPCDKWTQEDIEHYKTVVEALEIASLQKWIPVTERLPDRDDVIIAFYETMRGTYAEIQIHKAWAMSDTCTHWMPLPLPPKEGKR